MELPISHRFAVLGCLTTAVIVVGAIGGSSSSASSGAKPTPVTVAAGRVVFKANCGSCHTLGDAKTHGNVGPNLDKLKPSMKLVARQVTNGGGGMPSFARRLSKTKIQAVAKYVSTRAGKVKSTGGGGGGLP